MRLKITDKQARTIAPPAQGYALLAVDGAGLQLRITAAGARAWCLSYRTKGGISRRLTLGNVVDWPVQAAAAKARQLRQAIDEGDDPVQQGRDAREAETLGQFAERYMEEHFLHLRPASRRAYRHFIERWILPSLGKTKIRDIQAGDIQKLHRAVTAAGRSSTANRVLAVLSNMMTTAATWGLRQGNPCSKAVRLNPEEKREKYLTPAQLGDLLAALARRDHPAADLIRLLLLTGARRGETLAASWDQFDLTNGVWVKPPSATKSKKRHRTRLNAPARQLLAGLWARRAPGGQAVFAGVTVGALDYFWEQVCAEIGLTDFHIHDLRHTVASYLASHNLSLHVIGGVLGHSSPAVTNRYAHLMDDVQQQAADVIGGIYEAAAKANEGGADVLPLRPGKRR
jgi:integrase